MKCNLIIGILRDSSISLQQKMQCKWTQDTSVGCPPLTGTPTNCLHPEKIPERRPLEMVGLVKVSMSNGRLEKLLSYTSVLSMESTAFVSTRSSGFHLLRVLSSFDPGD